MKLVDANVLLYAVNESAERHRTARPWLDDALSGSETVGFAWVVVLAFIRLATHRAVFPRPLEAAEALGIVREWLVQPTAVVVEPTTRHLALLAELLSTAGTAGNLVNDAHLAALAVEHDGELISFDADFSRFVGVRWQPPSAG
jgi:toxin-antitoxin system PIN domain toxin